MAVVLVLVEGLTRAALLQAYNDNLLAAACSLGSSISVSNSFFCTESFLSRSLTIYGREALEVDGGMRRGPVCLIPSHVLGLILVLRPMNMTQWGSEVRRLADHSVGDDRERRLGAGIRSLLFHFHLFQNPCVAHGVPLGKTRLMPKE